VSYNNCAYNVLKYTAIKIKAAIFETGDIATVTLKSYPIPNMKNTVWCLLNYFQLWTKNYYFWYTI